MSIIITDHAYKRAKERLSWSRATTERMAKIAFENGQKPMSFSGSFRRYLDKSGIQHHHSHVIYGQHIFSFGGQALITILHIPAKFRSHITQSAQP